MDEPMREDDARLAVAGLVFGLAALIGLAVAVVLMRHARAARVPEIARGRGELARATVLKVWDTGKTQHEHPVVDFVFEVRRPRQAPYQTEVRCVVPRTLIPQVQPGATVPVRVDADNPARVALAFGEG